MPRTVRVVFGLSIFIFTIIVAAQNAIKERTQDRKGYVKLRAFFHTHPGAEAKIQRCHKTDMTTGQRFPPFSRLQIFFRLVEYVFQRSIIVARVV